MSAGNIVRPFRLLQDQLIIDVSNTEALNVRKDGDGGDIFNVDTINSVVSIGGVTPTLAFGDKDTGIVEIVDDILAMVCNGLIPFSFHSNRLEAGAGGGPVLWNTQALAGTPVFVFQGDTDTGIGRAGADELSLIAGGAEAARLDKSVAAGDTRLKVYDVDNATLERVTVGIADSGGAGFKLLRIPN